MTAKKIITTLFVTLLICTFCTGILFADVSLKFGVYSSDKPTAMVMQFKPILKIIEKNMSEKLGEPVKIKIEVSKTYSQGIKALSEGKVDFSRLGPASYIIAKGENQGVSILAIEHKKGKKRFNGIICVGEKSVIQSAADFKGKSFAFGDENSTIGRYLSQEYLVKNNIKAKDLSKYEYLGRHDKVGASVGIGKFDGGALKESTFKKLVKKGTAIKSLAIFPNVTKPWVARSELPANVLDALKGALLALKDKDALKKLKKDGFLEGSDQDYDFIRKAMENNHAFFE